MARHSSYNIDIAIEICEAIASCGKGLEDICKEHANFPNPKTVYAWLNLHEEFSKMYTRAKQQQIAVFMNDIIKIACDDSKDHFIDETGKRIANPTAVQRSRVEIDTKKWLASKLIPKIYGERIEHDVTTVNNEDLQRRKDLLDEKNKKEF